MLVLGPQFWNLLAKSSLFPIRKVKAPEDSAPFTNYPVNTILCYCAVAMLVNGEYLWKPSVGIVGALT